MAGHVLGIVKSAQGVVDVRAADGKIRSLLVGDQLREGDTVLTTGGGKLVIALSEGGELVLGPGEAVVMTEGSRILKEGLCTSFSYSEMMLTRSRKTAFTTSCHGQSDRGK